jgi:alpha-glucuronidase
MKKIFPILFLQLIYLITCNFSSYADDGYRLWLKYDLISNAHVLKEYRESIKELIVEGNSATMKAAEHELKIGLDGLLGSTIPEVSNPDDNGVLIVGTYKNSSLVNKVDLESKLKEVDSEGFVIFNRKINGKDAIIITGNTDVGVLHGVFTFLRILQTNKDIKNLDVVSYPKIKLRILDHWDNLNGTVERGYAGFSIWNWHTLPIYIKQRYIDYARANASIGINGTVLNNVNADPLILTHRYLVKVAALADVFRPYGIRVYLCANFDAPIKIGGLKTADPFDTNVKKWWADKVKEIYSLIPDFGGFLVKANSEGEPGPKDYGRTQAEGANLLADALKPYNGIVMWRAFVYTYNPKDRAKEAYDLFTKLDGKFANNVLLQVKNGPLDFQPREPFSPLFGAMPKTPLMLEFQITMEYLGQGTSTVFLAPLFKECLESDTYAKGKGSTVENVVDGQLFNQTLSGIAGVSNIGADRDWTGNEFGQSSWYAFGRLAWNPNLTSEEIANDWIRMTFSNDTTVIKPIEKIMLASRENVVNYMDPLGLNMIFGYNNHYGPGPWVDYSPHLDWNSTYYHKADSLGIGFNRTKSGSDAADQYFPPAAKKFNSLTECPEKYLLWFHHVKWDYKMPSGKTLWDEICYHYYQGVDGVREMQKTWNSLEGKIDEEEFHSEQMYLKIQEKEAVWWRNSCVLYFQTFSHMPIPNGFEKPDQTLKYYENLSFPNAPGWW